jgi:DNA (cytosine-5)-methyltransferase 1
VTRRVLDLFSGVGGAGKGWHDAGFSPYGVDNTPQPRYPYPFHHGDAFDVLDRLGAGEPVPFTHPDGTVEHLTGADLTVRHASPPCTEHSTLAGLADSFRDQPDGTGWMLEATIDRFDAWAAATGGVWVAENVEGARRAMRNPLKLCGSMFGLVDGGWLLRRHRYFDSNVFVMAPGPCRCHGRRIISVHGDLSVNDRRCAGTRKNRPHGDMRAGIARARRLMGIPWADARELALAIPPAYTQWIGEQIPDVCAALHREAS